MANDRSEDQAEQRFKELLRGRAYQLFHEEILRSVETVQQRLSAPPTADERHVAEMRRLFHSLKGSTGFFGFQDLQQAVGKFEDLLQTMKPNALTVLSDAQRLIQEIEHLARALPTPARKE